MKAEPVKRLICGRCGVSINPLLSRYLWVGWGERGASKFGKQGNTVFHRMRKTADQVLCGPCSDEWSEQNRRFMLGRKVFESLDTFERGVVRDDGS